MKRISFHWAWLVGLLSVVTQTITFQARFGHPNTDGSFMDYVLFFLSGSLGGLVLIFFLNRQRTAAERWVVVVAFLLVSPLALLMMLGGGLLGPLGVLGFPLICWVLVTWVGSLLGGWVTREG